MTQRASIRTLRPSVQPTSCNPCRNAVRRRDDSGSVAESPISTPMRRMRSDCSARATSGRAATAPPSSVMNSRRFITSPCRTFRFQLRPSKQESAPSETVGGCGNVRRTNPERPMSELGHSRRSDGQQGFAECPLCLQWRPNLCVATNRREWDGPAVLPPRTAQRMTGGLEARGAHRHVP